MPPRADELSLRGALLEPWPRLHAAWTPTISKTPTTCSRDRVLEPPADLDEAAEGLVSAVLMLADVSRPLRRRQHAAPRAPRGWPQRRSPPRPGGKR